MSASGAPLSAVFGHPDKSIPIARRHDVFAFQRFRDFAELDARLAGQGPLARARIDALRGERPVVIPMPYRLVRLA